MSKYYFNIQITLFFIGVFITYIFPVQSYGAVLRPEMVRDLISDSSPSAGVTHELTFRVKQTIPPSGKIIITPEPGAVLIPAAFNLADIDFAVAISSSDPYIERDIANIPSVMEEGAVIQTGFSGSLTFTLNSTSGLDPGNLVRIKLGTNAVYGGVGINLLMNSDIPRSYKIGVETRNSADDVIDSGGTMIAIILPVTVGPIDTTDRTPPVISSGLPTGLLPGGTKGVSISVETDELAFCRYATSSGISYDLMTGTFPAKQRIGLTPAYLHYNVVVRNLLDNTTYTYYIRCRDYQMNKNPDDYILSFKVGVVPIPGAGSGTGTGSGGTGSGSGSGTGGGTGDYTGPDSGPPTSGYGDAGGGNFLKTADVALSGTAYPFSKVAVLLDGKEKITATAGEDGKFSAKILGIERGTYTFGMYAVDTKGIRSAMISSTVSLIANTVNTVSGILFPPTIKAENNTVLPGEDIALSGMAIPNSTIEIYFGQPTAKFEGGSFSATTTTNKDGMWTTNLKTKGVVVGNYITQARSVFLGTEMSGFSTKLPLGVGKDAAPDFSLRADLNGDGKVNLVDFSILLFSWGKDDGVADINMNGNVDLPDFSIMIFYWTG